MREFTTIPTFLFSPHQDAALRILGGVASVDADALKLGHAQQQDLRNLYYGNYNFSYYSFFLRGYKGLKVVTICYY